MSQLALETYQDVLERDSHIATIVGFEKPVEATYFAINLLLFKDMPAAKTGNTWFIQYNDVEEYEIKLDSPFIAVVSSYYDHVKRGEGEIQRVEQLKTRTVIRPTPIIDLLPTQKAIIDNTEVDAESESLDDVALHPTKQQNFLDSETIAQCAANHDTLVNRLLSLEQYCPRLVETVSVPIDYLIGNRIK
ncbi:MAG: hypothetical protein GY861_07485 [bacterium]|nr:hypothetical protein [bacterium]